MKFTDFMKTNAENKRKKEEEIEKNLNESVEVPPTEKEEPVNKTAKFFLEALEKEKEKEDAKELEDEIDGADDVLTADELLDEINDLVDEEDVTPEEAALLDTLGRVIDASKDALDEAELSFIVKGLSKFVNMEEDEEDKKKNENEDDDEDMEGMDEEEMGGDLDEAVSGVQTVVRGGVKKKVKPGYRKVGNTYKKISTATLRKMRKNAKKRLHKKLKPATIAKMKRSRAKVERKFKSFFTNRKK